LSRQQHPEGWRPAAPAGTVGPPERDPADGTGRNPRRPTGSHAPPGGGSLREMATRRRSGGGGGYVAVVAGALAVLATTVLYTTAAPSTAGAGWRGVADRFGEPLLHGLFLGALFAFVTLAVRFPCQAAPLSTSRLPRLLATHGSAAVAATGLWLAGAQLFARGLDAGGVTLGGGERLAARTPLLATLGLAGYLLAAALHYLRQANETAQRAERRALEARAASREQELAALRSQVSPHFLFNCLNTISALVGRDPAAARTACQDLAQLLRQTLRLGEQDHHPLATELALVDAFLALEQRRFGSRLRVERELEPGLETVPVPPLVLLPLAENAVTHGIAGLLEGGVVTIRARRLPGRETGTGASPAGSDTPLEMLELEVHNPCDPEAPAARGAGSGLATLERRLRARYASRADLGIERQEESFRVRVRLPLTGLSHVP
jgi:two-component system sensor histidine kinase AlgZ